MSHQILVGKLIMDLQENFNVEHELVSSVEGHDNKSLRVSFFGDGKRGIGIQYLVNDGTRNTVKVFDKLMEAVDAYNRL